ncbi:uncharacterized protein LOC110275804 [Arachis duranensis]|uniref:Uncharacterized protein LOC110275804 n=1 Tax=Arachis duranensis TaxID=130453 RepID=A0A6P5MR17_ARADU|nr:uncharacterized protein LOC110275804 [Arachis duranensis]
MEENPIHPIILERPFLATAKALIDVERGELVLKIHDEQLTFNVFKPSQEAYHDNKESEEDHNEGLMEETNMGTQAPHLKIPIGDNQRDQKEQQPSEFNIEIRDKKGVENKVTDHLSRIPCEKDDAHDTSVNEFFLDEQLMMIHKAPWFADIANFKAAGDLPPGINKYQRRKLINDAKYFIWDEPYLFKKYSDGILRRCILEEEGRRVLWSCHSASYGGHFGGERTAAKVLQCGFF